MNKLTADRLRELPLAVAKFMAVADATEGSARMFDLAEAKEVVSWITALMEREARMRDALELIRDVNPAVTSLAVLQQIARAALQPKETDDGSE